MNTFDNMSNNELLKYLTDLNRKTESEKSTVSKLEEQVSSLTPEIVPAGIKDINKVIWPYTSSSGFLATTPTVPYQSKNIRVTQEAGFVVTKIIHQIFEKVAPNDYRWLDLRTDIAEDLYFNLSDPQSGRFFAQEPFNINHLGDALFVTKMLSRPFILPNSSMNIELYNRSATKTYYTNISLFGYKVRIEDATDILSLASAL